MKKKVKIDEHMDSRLRENLEREFPPQEKNDRGGFDGYWKEREELEKRLKKN